MDSRDARGAPRASDLAGIPRGEPRAPAVTLMRGAQDSPLLEHVQNVLKVPFEEARISGQR